MPVPDRILIVGAGHAGVAAAAALRRLDFSGEVMICGAESDLPYHRPPLSKSLLAPDLEQALQPEDFYRKQEIELRLGAQVRSIDRDRQEIRLAGGERLAYRTLILATGARPVTLSLPGAELEGVVSLRELADARRLERRFSADRRLAIAGGGWIGLELAAAGIAAGMEVTVIEREERVLSRVASPELSRFLNARHAERGVVLLTGAEVAGFRYGRTSISKTKGRAQGEVGVIELADGREIESDLVVVAVGAIPCDELARGCGVACDGGILVDERCATSVAGIFAIGDATRRPLAGCQARLRLESIVSANEQARVVAAVICGQESPSPEVPWFWSDQFDLKIQMAGIYQPGLESLERDPKPEEKGTVLRHQRGEELVAIETVNRGSDFLAGKREIATMLGLPSGSGERPTAPDGAEPGGVADQFNSGKGEDDRNVGGAVMDLSVPAPRVLYELADGSFHTVHVPPGRTVMDGATASNFPGIVAECGGSCSCGTCHIYVDSAWLNRLEEAMPEEEELIEFAEDFCDRSRLSCQIVMSEELDGLRVRIPSS